MKKIFKWILIILGVIIVLGILGGDKNKENTKTDTPKKENPVSVPKETSSLAKNGRSVPSLTLYEGWSNPKIYEGKINDIKGGWKDSFQINRKGDKIYFGYSRIDFSKFFYSNAKINEITGEVIDNVENEKFQSFYYDINNKEIKHVKATTGNKDVAEASLGVSSNEDLIIYAAWGHEGRSDAQLLMSNKIGDTWERPALIPLNTKCDDDNPFIVGEKNNFILYFESKRLDVEGKKCHGETKNLFIAEYKSGKWSEAREIKGLEITKEIENFMPFVTADNKYLYFASIRDNLYGIFKADLNYDTATNIKPQITPRFTPPFIGNPVALGEPSVVSSGNKEIMYFACSVATEEKYNKPSAAEHKLCVVERLK